MKKYLAIDLGGTAIKYGVIDEKLNFLSKGKIDSRCSSQEEFCEDITILTRGKAVVHGNLNEIKKSYGRVNLFVKCDEDISDTIRTLGIKVVNDTPAGMQLRVNNEAEAGRLLKELTGANKTIVRFELREPSLHEIFIESVGKVNDDSEQIEADDTLKEAVGE